MTWTQTVRNLLCQWSNTL